MRPAVGFRLAARNVPLTCEVEDIAQEHQDAIDGPPGGWTRIDRISAKRVQNGFGTHHRLGPAARNGGA